VAGRDVDPEQPRLVPFEPRLPPTTNGNGANHVRPRGTRITQGVVFGALLGGLVATNYVPRLQWLNLSQVGSWTRPVIAAGVAGMLTAAMRRGDSVWRAAAAGALAALIALWGVYAIVRISVRPLFVDRSITRVVLAELARLALYAAPAGALGAVIVRAAAARFTGRGGAR
jgi:hypothetical protein